MKRILKRVLSVIIVFAILFGAAPLNGFKGVGSSLWNGLCSIAASAKEGVEEIIENLTPANVSDNTLAATGQCGDNVYWSFNSSTGALTISGEGKMYNYSYNGSPFYYNSSIKSVTIESGVTSIGEGAFYGCSSLTSIDIPNSVTSIGSVAFAYCSSLTSIEIPDNVTSIGSSTFYKCSSLTSVTIPDSVTSIGYYAFIYCSSLTSITVDNNNNNYSSDSFGVLYNKDKTLLIQYPIGNERTLFSFPDSVTSIADYAFYECSSLTSVKIGNSLTSIGDYAFYYCSGLTSITIPDSVTSIGWYAFYYCSSLTSIEIPDSVTSIGSGAFLYCSSLTAVYITDIDAWAQISFGDSDANPLYYAKNLYLNNVLVEEVTLSDIVTSISDYAFYYCSSLTSIEIPDGVTSIGSGSFEGCSSLTSITIPDSVTSIGSDAFSGCPLENVVMGNGLTSIPSTLINKQSLKSFLIGNGVTSIGNSAFRDCSSLTSVTIPDSVTSIDSCAFYYCSSLTSIDIPDSVTSIGEYAFAYCRSLTSVEIPDGVTSIGWWAFAYCNSLTSITVDNNNNNYSSDSFGVLYNKNKTVLIKYPIGNERTSFTIPDSVTSIADYAFYECSSLTSVKIGNSVTSIGYRAFLDCSSLTSIVIPDSVTSIGEYAFASCRSLNNVHFKGSCKEWKNINISSGNYYLTSASKTYDSHDYQSVVTPPTCMQKGYTTYKCSFCGYIYVDDYTDVIPHNYVPTVTAPTCTQKGYTMYKCSGCGDYYYDDYTDVIPHNYVPTVTAPTCTQKGYTTYKCSGCGKSYVDDYVNAKGHTPGEWVVTIEPTTEKEGAKTCYCTVCGEFVQSAVIPKITLSKVKSVTVTDVSLNYLGTTVIKPIINADEGVNYGVTYKSNSSAVSVDQSGRVTSNKTFGFTPASATITCTVTDTNGNTVSDTCTVTVQFSAIQWIIKILLFGWIWY